MGFPGVAIASFAYGG